MTNVVNLITDQDLEAFVDEQSANARAVAIERRVETDPRSLAKVAALTRINGDLLAVKSRLYQDKALQQALAVLFCQKAA